LKSSLKYIPFLLKKIRKRNQNPKAINTTIVDMYKNIEHINIFSEVSQIPILNFLKQTNIKSKINNIKTAIKLIKTVLANVINPNRPIPTSVTKLTTVKKRANEIK